MRLIINKTLDGVNDSVNIKIIEITSTDFLNNDVNYFVYKYQIPLIKFTDTGEIFNIKSFKNDLNPSISEILLILDETDLELISSGGSGGDIGTIPENQFVNSYSDLPDPTTVLYQIWICKNSEGTQWLPGSLGGTYYSEGTYVSNGIKWIYYKSSYQATQVEVDAGINNDKFVTPLTLKNSTQWDTKLNITDLPSNLVLYPTTATSDIATYYKLVTDIHDVDYNTTALDVNTGVITTTTQLISSLSTKASLIIGNPGVFNITVVGNIRKISGSGDADFYFQVYKRDNVGIETLITTSSNTPTVTSSVYEQFNATALWDDGVFTTTDRIVLKFYANRIAGSSDPEYQFQFGGAAPVRALVPVPLSTIGYTKTEVDTLLDAKQDVLTIDALPIDGSINAVSSNGVFDALALKTDNIGGTLFFGINGLVLNSNQTITVSSNGLQVTLSNIASYKQFEVNMVGAKLQINGVERIISVRNSTSVVTVSQAYPSNMFNQVYDFTKLVIYCKSYESLSSGTSAFYTGLQNGGAPAASLFMNNSGGYVNTQYGYQIGTVAFYSDGCNNRSTAVHVWSNNNSNYTATKDLGLRRNAPGILEIYDGVTATGLLANRRDLLVRNVNASQYNLSILNTAPASTTATGTTGEIRYTADFIYVCIATNSWVRTALTTW